MEPAIFSCKKPFVENQKDFHKFLDKFSNAAKTFKPEY